MTRTLAAALAAFSAVALVPTAFAQKDAPKPPAAGEKKSGRAPAKPQSEVAAKNVTLGTVAASDAKVKSALAATDLAGAKKAVGKPGAFVGTVTDVFSPRNNGVTILNFAPNFRDAMTAVAFPKTYAALPDLSTLKGKKVLVTGTIAEYKGGYQIVLNGPDQIKLVK